MASPKNIPIHLPLPSIPTARLSGGLGRFVNADSAGLEFKWGFRDKCGG